MATQVDTDVLIIGAGPAGAAAALLLATAGISCLVVNKYPSTSPGPRAHITNQRTMEILRDLGLEDAAKQLATPWELMGEHPFATSLVGEEFGRIPAWASDTMARAEHAAASPSSYCDLPQLYFEPLLVNAAALRGAQVRFRTEYLSHQQDDEGVSTELLDHVSGQRYTVRSRFLLGADGARSKVAADVQLPFEGQMAVGNSGSINVEFSADLSLWCAHRPSDMYWMLQPGSGLNGTGVGVLRMVRPWNKWVCVWGYDLNQGAPDLSHEQARAIVHKIIGSSEVEVQIDAISTWTINQQYATRNTAGRVFCLGDAVHRHTPMAGLGLNTSMQDAYNLAWKLALVLKGQAGMGLLQSYDAERSPVARQVVEHAFGCLHQLPPIFHALGLPPGASGDDFAAALERLKAPTAEGAQCRKELQGALMGTLIGFGGAAGVELNQRYASQAIVPDGSPDPGFARDAVRYYQASSRPGAHLPHAWLTQGQRRVSTLDLCGQGRFTLLTGLSGQAWVQAASAAAGQLGMALKVQVIGPGRDYVDSYGEYARIREIAEDGALLVRPDMVIAWRADSASSERLAELPAVLRGILQR